MHMYVDSSLESKLDPNERLCLAPDSYYVTLVSYISRQTYLCDLNMEHPE